MVGGPQVRLRPRWLALGPGPSQPSVDPLLEHGPLELGEDAAHLEQGAAGGVLEFDVLLVKVEIDAEGLELGEHWTRCWRLRPSRSTDHAATRSNSRCVAALIRSSRPGRLSLPLAPEMWSAKVAKISQPLRSALQDYSQWVHLIAAMLRGGFTPEEAGKIAGGNYIRIFRAAVG